jgi:glutamate-1-semialdehyde 2,1-aminomutase
MEEMKIDKGLELWRRARKIIPGGSQLLSKRSEQFLPEQWPSYYDRAKGVEIWDLDGNRFVDMSIMGVGACILGYADDDVDRAAKQAIDRGSMTTLNCPEEVELAEMLLKLHPWADMVRYARTGGEAMTVSIRIARAFTGKDKIAFCGYHGWHDWYLSANLANDKSLDGHLLPGLKPKGVPRTLMGTALPFNYNQLGELQSIVAENDIGTIVLEPIRHQDPKKGFLEGIRKIADEIDAVLVFDEITSGWRMRMGGMHETYNVLPDIVVYGKAMSNGYPMAALVGKGEVMDAAQDSFISSTYWTERVGPSASIATINKMVEKNVPNHLIRIGKMIGHGLEEMAKEHDINLEVMGLPPLTTFALDYGSESQALHTFFTQEMIKRGFLASKSIYVSYSHQPQHVHDYLEAVSSVFELLRDSIEKGDVLDHLKGPVAHEGFKRLN